MRVKEEWPVVRKMRVGVLGRSWNWRRGLGSFYRNENWSCRGVCSIRKNVNAGEGSVGVSCELSGIPQVEITIISMRTTYVR